MNTIQLPTWSLYCALILAVFFSLLPWAAQVQAWMPNWIVLVLLFWVMVKPEKVSLGFIFLVGILLDVLLGTFIGLHAFNYLTITALAFQIRHRFSFYSLLQQACILSGFALLSVNFIYAVQSLSYPTLFLWQSWGTALTTGLLWVILVTFIPRPMRWSLR